MAPKYIIKNATVLSVDETIGNIHNCDVLIEDGIIKAVGPNLNHSDHAIIDGTDAIVSPGFIDTHRHTWQTQLRTLCTDFVLSDYLLNIRHIYGSCYSVEDTYLGNYCGALESIDNGITYLIDHSHIMNSPDHADAAIKGLRDAKIRGTFCYGFYANPAWAGSNVDPEREKDVEWRLTDARRAREAHFPSNAPDQLLRFGVAPSEAEAIPFEELLHQIETARSIGAAIITAHIALGKFDGGHFMTRRFGELDLLGSDFLWSHANSLTDDEMDLVKKYDLGLSSTPEIEMQMGVGYPIAYKAKEHGLRVGLGVDITSNCPGDMFQQMRLVLQAQRYEDQRKSPFPLPMARPCAEVLEMATMGGARAVGLEKIIGSITPGKRADLIITKCDSTRLTPVHEPVAALVNYANGSDIDTVMVNGEILKSGGKLVNVDWPKIRAEVRKSAARIMAMSKLAPRDQLEDARNAMVSAVAMAREKIAAPA
ncbi:Metallo-dependent hydrolase [Colletotrichum zoysiae]|uniref:Metallo-dependent hydrolase n=1 Tax=Colletotrichum zoysiae TaxID=1216348 RepID=A0AAD9HH31_9PEZI|nr:Metallo-dependent hydrolase [Colletotrichum zoysiae]